MMAETQQDQNSKENRRKLLKGALASGGVVGVAATASWTKPVVESVLLPAHAATSAVAALRSFVLTGTMAATDQATDTRVVKSDDSAGGNLLDILVPSAHAQTVTTADTFDLVLREQAANRFSLQMLSSQTSPEDCTLYSLLTAAGLRVGVSGSGDVEECDGRGTFMASVTVDSVSNSEAAVTVDGMVFTGLLRVGSAPTLTLPGCDCDEVNGGVNGGMLEL